MAYISEVGKRITIKVTYKKSFHWVDTKYSYYPTTHYIHHFVDAEGNTIVWKSTNIVEYVEGRECKFVTEGSVVELTGTVKEHSTYKEVEQTVVTRCKFKLIEAAKTEWEIQQEKAEAQMQTIGENDIIWEMPYKQYKEHYSDCETIIGSYDAHIDSRGIPTGHATIKVIIRDGRLKKSGVRGQHFSGYQFRTEDGKLVTYRAVSEETARKQMKKEFPNSDESWECVKVFNYNTHRIW